MADPVKNTPKDELTMNVPLTIWDKAWIKQSIGVQIKALSRSRQKEIQGGEVYALRSKEIDTLNALLAKFG